MEKKNDKRQKRQDLYISEVRKFSSDIPGDLRDFTGLAILRKRNPDHRPVCKVFLGRTEISMKEVLRATGLAGELTRVQVPEEEIICSNDVFVAAIDVQNLNAYAVYRAIMDLQDGIRREDEKWLKNQRERRRRKRRLRQKRWRSRQKTKRIEASEKENVARRRSDNNTESPKDVPGDTVRESNLPPRPQV